MTEFIADEGYQEVEPAVERANLTLVPTEAVTPPPDDLPTDHVSVTYADDVEQLLSLSPVHLKPVLDRTVLARKLELLGEYTHDSVLPLDIHVTGYPLGHRYAGKTGYTRDKQGVINHRYLVLPILTLGDIGAASENYIDLRTSVKLSRIEPEGESPEEQADFLDQAWSKLASTVKAPGAEEDQYLKEAVGIYDPKRRNPEYFRVVDYTASYKSNLFSGKADLSLASLMFGGVLAGMVEYGFDGNLLRAAAAGVAGSAAVARSFYGTYKEDRAELQDNYDRGLFNQPGSREIIKEFDYLKYLIARKNAVNRIIVLSEA